MAKEKKITLQTGLQEELLAALSALTAVTDNTLIQIYDDELDDYVDLEPGTCVQNKAKIKLSRKLVLQADCTSLDITSQLPCASQAVASDIGCPEPTAGTSDIVIESTVPVEDRRDYLNFVLPSFGHYEEILARGTPINGPVRRAIVDRLFQACFKLDWYPSKELYRTAAERLVHKYPHLIDRLGTQTSGLESWVLSLRNKFKNMRKKIESCPPEMMEKREKSQQKRPRQHEASIPNKKLCRLFDSSHLIIYGETAESVERHNHWLQVNAASADESGLRPRLLATAQARHEHLRSLTISEALVLFPFLASEASLLLEFDILFKKNIAEEFAKGCQQLCDGVLEHATDVEMTAFTHAARDNPILATLEFVAGRCNEVLTAILLEKDIPLTPCLLKEVDGRLSLYIDREKILEATSLLGGMSCLFASFWVFNVEYPKKAHRVLTFFEHAFLGLSYTKLRVKALEMINFFRGSVAPLA